MLRIFTFVYIFAALGLTLWSVIAESYPALFFINIFAQKPGEKYPASLVVILTLLALLLPMVLVLFVAKLIRNREPSHVDDHYFTKSGIRFFRLKQMQHRLISTPIYIDGELRGRVDSGKNAFIELAPGSYNVHVGKHRESSEKLLVQVEEHPHAQVEIELEENGLRSKYVITRLH